MHLMDWLPIFSSPFAVHLNGLHTPMLIDVANTRLAVDAVAFPPDKTPLWLHPLEEDGWTHAHNAVRGELSVMNKVLKVIGDRPLAEWEVSSLRTWWENHLVHVHDHHYNEDAIFTPFMATRFHVPAKLTTDHVPLVAKLDALSRRIDALRAGATVGDLRSEWSRYDKMMRPHLFEEEQVALPLLRAYFEPKEVGALVEKILGSAPPVALGSFLYFMGGTKEACSKFMENEGIPWFVWYLAFSGHLAVYHEKMVKHAEALLSGVPPPPDASNLPVAPLGVALAAILASLALYRRRRAASKSLGLNVVAVPPSPSHKTLSPTRKFTRPRIC